MKRTIGGVVFEQALIDSICTSQHINPKSARVAFLKGESIKPSKIAEQVFWVDEGPLKRIYSSHHITAETIKAYARSLREFAPDILFCYPSSVAALASHLDASDRLHIPLVFASSEVLHPRTIADVRQKLGCDIIDFYGHSERIVSAVSLNEGEYRFAPAYGHAELLPCGDGRARIIATSLWPHGQIFVRYDTGDIAKVGSQDSDILEQVALGILPFEGIEGRDSEYVELPDGRRIVGLNQIARGADGATSVQLHYSADNLVDLYVVPGTAFDTSTRERILTNLYAKFPKSVAARLWIADLPVRESSGKAPFYLRNPIIPETKILLDHKSFSRQAA